LLYAQAEFATVIRLTKEMAGDGQLTIRVEGRLGRDDLAELLALVGSENQCATTTLELSGLTSADPDGRAALARLKQAGCRLVGASLYLHTLLEEVES
jgi:ABC-type transporter Mla MlaB component